MTYECWYNHILIKHPEIKEREVELRRAIEAPDYFYRNKRRHSSRLYFLEISSSLKRVEYMLVVVAVRQRARKGYIQTAFIVKSLSKGG